MKKLTWVVLLPLLLAACGWQLRGSQTDATDIKQINLHAGDIYTPLYRTFQQELEHRGIELVNNESAPRLELVRERRSSRVVSYNTELDPAEDEITLTINYLINNQAFEIQEKQTYQRNKNRVAARENEKEILLEQMRKQLVGRVLRQVTLVHGTKTTSSP